MTDAEDLYVYELDPNDKEKYWHNGEWLTFKTIKESIKVKGMNDQNVDLRYSIHGPDTFIDSIRNKGYSVRCGWLEVGGSPYLASLRMNQSNSWEEFREACNFSNIPGENMVWADREGNIVGSQSVLHQLEIHTVVLSQLWVMEIMSGKGICRSSKNQIYLILRMGFLLQLIKM